MRGLIRNALASISLGSLLTAIAGSPALRRDFNRPLPAPPVRPENVRQGQRYRQPGRRTTLFMPHGEREKSRRVRQGAHEHQLRSHKPGTVQPHHIFAIAPREFTE